MMKNLIRKITIISFLGVLIGCSDNDFPVPQASTVDAKFTFEADETMISFINGTKIAEDAGTVSYAWSFGDGTSSTEANPVHEYSSVGIYNVRLVATADNDVDFYDLSVAVIGSLDVQLFFSNGKTGQIGELPGTKIAVNTPGQVFGVDYDPVNEKVYFTDNGSGTLYRSDLDGENLETLYQGLGAARDVALNLDDNIVYVVDRATHEVIAVDMETLESDVLYSAASDGLGELPVGIDYYDGNVYVTSVEIGSESVWKGSVNGAGIANIINYGAGGYGYAIAIDKVNEKIYFDNTDSKKIMVADLDGSNISEVSETTNNVYGIVVDNVNELIYWSDSGDKFIKKANLDGSDVVPVSLALDDPLGVFIVPN